MLLHRLFIMSWHYDDGWAHGVLYDNLQNLLILVSKTRWTVFVLCDPVPNKSACRLLWNVFVAWLNSWYFLWWNCRFGRWWAAVGFPFPQVWSVVGRRPCSWWRWICIRLQRPQTLRIWWFCRWCEWRRWFLWCRFNWVISKRNFLESDFGIPSLTGKMHRCGCAELYGSLRNVLWHQGTLRHNPINIPRRLLWRLFRWPMPLIFHWCPSMWCCPQRGRSIVMSRNFLDFFDAVGIKFSELSPGFAYCVVCLYWGFYHW